MPCKSTLCLQCVRLRVFYYVCLGHWGVCRRSVVVYSDIHSFICTWVIKSPLSFLGEGLAPEGARLTPIRVRVNQPTVYRLCLCSPTRWRSCTSDYFKDNISNTTFISPLWAPTPPAPLTMLKIAYSFDVYRIWVEIEPKLDIYLAFGSERLLI